VRGAEHAAAIGERADALTTTGACAELRRELGVYLLGAINPADRSGVERHLARCTSCRNQVADLAALPALLRRVSLDEVERQLPRAGRDVSGTQSDRPLASLLRQAAKRRRRRAWWKLAALAAVGIAAGAAAASGAPATPPRQPAWLAAPGAVTVRGSNLLDKASAIIAYTGLPWGVQLHVQVNGIAVGTQCVLEVTDSSGHESEAASFTVAAGDVGGWYAGASSVPVTSVRAFVVTAGAQVIVPIKALDSP
jgi:Putative zinc-finger